MSNRTGGNTWGTGGATEVGKVGPRQPGTTLGQLRALAVSRATEINSCTDFLRKTLKAKMVLTPNLFLGPAPSLPRPRKEESKRSNSFIYSFIQQTFVSVQGPLFPAREGLP